MNTKSLTSAVIVAVVGFTLALPGTALAEREDRGYRQGHSHDDGYRDRSHRRKFDERGDHHRRDRYRDAKRHRAWDDHDSHQGRHRARHYDRHGDRHHDKHYRKHQRKHDKHHYKHHRKYDRHYGYGNRYYKDDDDDEKLLIGLVVGGILGYALNEHRQGSYDDDYFYDNSYTPNGTARHNDGTCLQEREYQTVIVVGGREVDAYGTACLQPDGSWKRGPARVAAY